MSIREISTAACWLAIFASFVLSFSTWLALGDLAGFGRLALAMPLCVDGYIVTALATWLMPEVSERLARFARANLYSVGLASVAAQAGYHGGIAYGQAVWRVALAMVAGGLPPAIAVLAVHIRARTVRELATPQQTEEPEVATDTQVSPGPPIVAITLSEPAVPAAVPSPAVSAPAARTAAPRPSVEKRGSGPRSKPAGEADVAAWLAAGMSHRDIGQRLGVSTRTATRRIAEARTGSESLVAAS